MSEDAANTWHLSHQAWNAIMHALHGNTSPERPAHQQQNSAQGVAAGSMGWLERAVQWLLRCGCHCEPTRCADCTDLDELDAQPQNGGDREGTCTRYLGHIGRAAAWLVSCVCATAAQRCDECSASDTLDEAQPAHEQPTAQVGQQKWSGRGHTGCECSTYNTMVS